MALLSFRDDSADPRADDQLQTEIQSVGTNALVALAGEIDVSTVGELYEQFAALAREGVCHVSLKMAEVTHVDSTCLSVLVAEHKRMDAMNGELIVFSPSAELRKLFEITALDTYLNIRPQRQSSELKERPPWEEDRFLTE
jgi:anti-sigma B factor antagonist